MREVLYTSWPSTSRGGGDNGLESTGLICVDAHVAREFEAYRHRVNDRCYSKGTDKLKRQLLGFSPQRHKASGQPYLLARRILRGRCSTAIRTYLILSCSTEQVEVWLLCAYSIQGSCSLQRDWLWETT